MSNSHIDTRSGAEGTVPSSPLLTTQRELQNMHLSSHEPRYIPGMVARASRRDSLRRSSAHESDDAVSSRNNLRKNDGGEEPT
ncbi:hypothetical protein EV127DRAFT_418724 [Xylaria flabelliformis]|nr:hypothetical protein EV127DRAFT_418724 [Xylaria flabelliformis]